MFGYILASLALFAFAGTILMPPTFRSDLTAFATPDESDDGVTQNVHKLVADISIIIPGQKRGADAPGPSRQP